jgi:hypothetical protein
MKSDAVIRVPRRSWEIARKFSVRSGRELRELTGIALEEYVFKESLKAGWVRKAETR